MNSGGGGFSALHSRGGLSWGAASLHLYKHTPSHTRAQLSVSGRQAYGADQTLSYSALALRGHCIIAEVSKGL